VLPSFWRSSQRDEAIGELQGFYPVHLHGKMAADE